MILIPQKLHKQGFTVFQFAVNTKFTTILKKSRLTIFLLILIIINILIDFDIYFALSGNVESEFDVTMPMNPPSLLGCFCLSFLEALVE